MSGWALHFKMLSRSPFELFVALALPVMFATIAYFLFKADSDVETLLAAAIASGVMGVWSVTGTSAAAALQRQRRLGILELLVAAPLPFWSVVLPIAVAISATGIYSLAAGLLYMRVLFGVPIDIASWPAFALAAVATILSIGSLGFLFTSAMVRFRAAWAVGNMFEWPVWLLCGLLVPVALLPTWLQPVSWILAPYWGMNALREAALDGGLPWVDVAVCAGLAVAYGGVGAVLLRVFLRSARQNATLSLT